MTAEADILLLRLDAPLMSFGGIAVDERRPTDPMPGLSMLTGLVANALGVDHAERDRLDALQARLRVAARCDHPGRLLRDFQTVDLGQDFLTAGWTTRGAPEGRGGGTKSSTHIRLRDYLADAVYTVALTLASPDLTAADHAPDLTVDDLERALRRPERPLFLGRKACLPASPLLVARVSAASAVAALVTAPWAAAAARRIELERAPRPATLTVWWGADDTAPEGVRVGRRLPVWDRRDWHTQTHTGRRWLYEGTVPRPVGESSSMRDAELAAAANFGDFDVVPLLAEEVTDGSSDHRRQETAGGGDG